MNHSTTIIEGLPSPQVRARPRFYFLVLLLLLVVGFLSGRSAYLQVMQGPHFRAEAEGNRVATLPIPAPRGIMYDRFKTQLVENISSTDLVLDPALLPKEEDESYLLEKLPTYVPGLTPETIREQLQKARQTQQVTLLASALDHDTVLRVEEAAESVPGTRLISSLVRQYPFAYSTAHLLGYTSLVTAEELKQKNNLLPTDLTGKIGLEREYNDILAGQHGIAYTEVDAAGRPQKDLGKQDPVAGKDLDLTIDIRLQNFIYGLFSEKDAKQRENGGKPILGAVVAMDPRSGEIRALVSYPSFDTNTFAQPGRHKESAKFFQAPEKPLFDRATDGMYPPGSTIKPFLAAAGLQEGVITEDSTVLSTGGIQIGPWFFPDWKAGGHGVTGVKKAIAESVNTFFYLLTGGDDTHRGLGVEKATEYLRRFGWGTPTNIDLPSEAAGFLPSPSWKERTKKERWYIGDTYHLGIGQGDVLVTPLQLTQATAAIANREYIYQPHLVVSQVKGTRIGIDRQYIDIVRDGMRQTVLAGSGRRLADLPIPVAGKTGTAQSQSGVTEDTHAWFTSFAPFDNPDLVLTVLVEKGGEGDKVAVPFAQEIWQWWIENKIKN